MFSLLDAAAKFAAAGVELEHVMDHVVEEAAKTIQNSAKTAIGTYRFGWEPLAQSTIERKGFDAPLFKTGDLQESIEVTVNGREADVGTNIPYAKYQEFGTSRIPARPFIGGAVIESEEDIKKFVVAGLHKTFNL